MEKQMSDKSKTVVAPDNNFTIYWDDAHIAAEAEFFPPELTELYRRVKMKCREELGGDMGRVTEAFARIGAKRDKTTWARIFKKGRWNHDADGEELPNPIVAPQKLAQEFQALLNDTRVELLRNKTPFVETKVWSIIRNFVAKKMRPERVNRFGVITGPTGMQKSACFKELAARNTNIKHTECSENASMNQLISLLAFKYGISHYCTAADKRFRIYDCFGPDKCIIFDNTQDLRSPKGSALAELDKFLKFLRWLQDERGGTIIIALTPQDEDAIFPKDSVFMEQFEGRAGGRDGFLRLPDRNPVDDLVAIAESLGMRDARKHADLLQEIGSMRGRIRTFYEILQDAKYAADKSNRPLTVEFIQEELDERSKSRRIGK
jgi:hypothetical protein